MTGPHNCPCPDCRSIRRLLWGLILVSAIGLVLVALTVSVGFRSLGQRVDHTEQRAAFRRYLRDPPPEWSQAPGDPPHHVYAGTMLESDERLWRKTQR